MSLPEFLREGGDAIVSQLGHMFESLDLHLSTFTSTSSSTARKNHWTDRSDEIMQQESSPLSAADITSDLRKQFAYLSGGRGANGSPIIVFPEFPAFGEIQDREFHNVLTYLTSVPSLSSSGVGFILVIDRRQDRWASVKGTLLRIAGSFPGNLQLVLVLRPSTLFQRALSDLLFKFNKDDFKMKVPVIMISSLSELHSYVERGQLTRELGGDLSYCHTTWITHRTAIEGFAVLVKRTAQALQTFGTELAETELPTDTHTTHTLLHTHTCRKDAMKEDLRAALAEGGSLLESINEPVVRDPDHNMTQDQLENLATVQRLLSQLNETDQAFDEFWARHQSKLEQCLQLRRFEDEYREVHALLEQACDWLTAFSQVGISPAHAEHLFTELVSHEERTCEVLDRAQSLALQGDELIGSSHYAQEQVQTRLAELGALSEDVRMRMRSRKQLLISALDLHHRLDRACRWCEEGVFLLASQPVDRCQSHEGAESALRELQHFLDGEEQSMLGDLAAIFTDYEEVLNQELRAQVEKVYQKQLSMQEMFDRRRVSLNKLAAKHTRPVQPVAPRPESLSSPAHRVQPERPCPDQDSVNGHTLSCDKEEELQQSHASLSEEEENSAVLRRHVMNELLETERAYVEELLCVLEGYASEMDSPSMLALMPPPLQGKKDVLFGNMPEIYTFHKRTFLKELEEYTDCPELVGRCFLERMSELQIYEKYCQNKPRSESLWRQCSDCAFFQECQKKLEHKLGLDSYLLKPVQRITKYQLLLKEMLKYSKGCDGTADLQEALSSILGILKAVNDSMHLIAITGYEGNLSELGRLLMQGSFSVWAEHKRGHAKVKELARFKPMQRHLFLHQHALLFCKRREESGEGYEKAPSYSFKMSLSMSLVGITENAKGDNKKFEIWCNSREEVYIVQAPSAEVKTMWVNEIRKVLTTQLEAFREASQQRATDSVFQFPPGPGAPLSHSPFRSGQWSLRRVESGSPDHASSPSPSASPSPKTGDKGGKDESPDRSAVVKKRFTLQGFSNLKGQRDPAPPEDKSLTLPTMHHSPPGSLSSPEHKTKRHEIKSDPTPFGFKGWTKASLSSDLDGYSSNDDPEEEEIKLTAGKYSVVADYEGGGATDLPIRSGDRVQLVREGDDGQWFVRHLKSCKEGWVEPAELMTIIGPSQSCLSLTGSDESGSGNLSSSSSCSETTYTTY